MRHFIYTTLVLLFCNFSFSQLVCGDSLIDSGGSNGVYQNNEIDTFFLCPGTPGEAIQLIFNTFETESGYDFLTIYDGNSTSGTVIGSYDGTNNPGTIVAENPTGCLTIVWTSDISITYQGWSAMINCVPLPTCLRPSNLGISNITDLTALLNWTSNDTETRWVVEIDTVGFVPGTSSMSVIMTNPYTFNGLNQLTEYEVYIRAFCGPGDTSNYTGPISFTTGASPLFCGDIFMDSGDSTDTYELNQSYTVTACPTNPGDVIQVVFEDFALDNGFDFLTIYDANNATNQIGTYTGTNSPGTIVAENTSGCLTFSFQSDGFAVDSGWYALINCIPAPTCLKPVNLTTFNATNNSLDLSWFANNGESSWLVEYGAPGFQLGTGTQVVANSNPFTLNGLTATTSYEFYVKAICSSIDSSSFSNNPGSGTTLNDPFICGNLFTDPGGPNGVYANNISDTNTICPSGPNEVVLLDFTMFNTENNYDSLMIFNGSSTSDPLIGSYQGSVDPGMIYSTSTDGCLTAVFISDGSVTYDGWQATISCVPPLTCFTPTGLSAQVQNNSADLSWTSSGSETQWVLEYGPAGFTPGTGTISLVSTNPAHITGLNASTQYDFYVSAYCAADDTSFMAGPHPFTTAMDPFICGNMFYDNGGPGLYANNSIDTIVICPSPGFQTVVVNFLEFNTELNYDSLMIFNGNSTAAPLIGSYQGTNSPGLVMASNPTGCLTFLFTSDNIVADSGWVAQIDCLVSLNELEGNSVSVYPNPSSGKYNLQNKSSEALSFELTDINGRKIQTAQQQIKANSSLELNLTHLQDGVYFVKLLGSNGTSTLRLVKN